MQGVRGWRAGVKFVKQFGGDPLAGRKQPRDGSSRRAGAVSLEGPDDPGGGGSEPGQRRAAKPGSGSNGAPQRRAAGGERCDSARGATPDPAGGGRGAASRAAAAAAAPQPGFPQGEGDTLLLGGKRFKPAPPAELARAKRRRKAEERGLAGGRRAATPGRVGGAQGRGRSGAADKGAQRKRVAAQPAAGTKRPVSPVLVF